MGRLASGFRQRGAMEENAEIELNVEEPVGECEEKKKKKRKLVRRRKKKDPCAEEDGEEDDELDDDAAQRAAFEATKRQRRRSTLSLEVQKMAEGKPLTHFQAMAMLRKALVASFIKPATGKDKAPEMKNTENRRLSAVYEVDKKMEGVKLEEKCLLLKSADKETGEDGKDEAKEENGSVEEEDGEKSSTAVKLVGQVAGKKSTWKIVEKQFIQGRDVSKNDAWKLIFLSDIFPKGSRGLQDLHSGSHSDDYDSEASNE